MYFYIASSTFRLAFILGVVITHLLMILARISFGLVACAGALRMRCPVPGFAFWIGFADRPRMSIPSYFGCRAGC